MLHYAIKGNGADRVLIVEANSAQRFRFWHKDGAEQVCFRRIGSRLIAAVTGKVMVYKKPNAQQFHREYMAANSRALWLGLQVDTDRLIDNMLEYEETL